MNFLNKKLKQFPLLKDISIYGLGLISSKAIIFLTIPIYTRIFSIEEYGIIELLMTWASIIGILMNIGLDTTLSYYFMETKNGHNKYSYEKIISSTTDTAIECQNNHKLKRTIFLFKIAFFITILIKLGRFWF